MDGPELTDAATLSALARLTSLREAFMPPGGPSQLTKVDFKADWLTPSRKVDLECNEKPKTLSGNTQILVLKDVPVESDATFYFTCQAQLLQNPDNAMWATLNTHVVLKLEQNRQRMVHFGKMNHVRAEDGWVEIGGDFATPSDITAIDILVTVQNQELEMEILTSSLTLSRLLPNSCWKEEANKRIAILRKGKITLKVTLTGKYDPQKLMFKLVQTRSAFPIGSAVDGHRLGGKRPEDIKYCKALYEHFNWATPGNDVKWRIMERHEGEPNFRNADLALDNLEPENFGVRGHCLLWARTSKIPSWLVDKTPEEIRQNIMRRFEYCASHFGDRFSHWDVNNEQLHEAWYAEKLSQPNILSWMFDEFHKMVPSAQLFVNDFFVFATGLFTQAYKQQICKLLLNGAPIGGIGLQSHFGKKASIELLMKRLSVLSGLGLPIWLTEFDIRMEDEDEQVELFEDVLRLCFSHPSIHGIILWGFWNQAMGTPVSALMKGPNFELTTLGKKFQELFHGEWRTNKTLTIPEGTQPHQLVALTTSAFHGSYRLTAIYDDTILWVKGIELQPKENVVIYIDV